MVQTSMSGTWVRVGREHVNLVEIYFQQTSIALLAFPGLEIVYARWPQVRILRPIFPWQPLAA